MSDRDDNHRQTPTVGPQTPSGDPFLEMANRIVQAAGRLHQHVEEAGQSQYSTEHTPTSIATLSMAIHLWETGQRQPSPLMMPGNPMTGMVGPGMLFSPLALLQYQQAALQAQAEAEAEVAHEHAPGCPHRPADGPQETTAPSGQRLAVDVSSVEGLCTFFQRCELPLDRLEAAVTMYQRRLPR